MRLRIEEKPHNHDVWGNLIDVEVEGEGEELAVLELAKRYVKREHTIKHDGRAIGKSIDERIEELRGKGVKGRGRGARR